jgi:PAS domain S-box-containing protein
VPLYRPAGDVSGLIGVSSDVTDLIVLDQARKEGEERFRRLAEAGFEGLTFTREGRFLQVNRQFAELVGWEPEELIGQEIWGFVSPEFHHLINLNSLAESADSYEIQLRNSNGQLIPVEIQTRTMPYGGETALVTAVRDISERKRAEISLRDTQERLNLALNAARMGTWDWDMLTDMIRWDAQFGAIYQGESRASTASIETVFAWIHADDREEVERTVDRVVNHENENFDSEYRVIWPDFSIHTLISRGYIFRDPSGKAIRMVGISWDVTDRKAIEEEIRRLNVELERRVNERTAQLQTALSELESFSYSVSHDLRSPLRAMNGFSRLLEVDYAGILDEQGVDYLHRISDASRHMSQLIDDLLNLSRYTRFVLNIATIDLSELARSVAGELAQSDPHRKASWSIEDGVFARGDEHLMRVVMQNLFGNAWKFTRKKPEAIIEFGTLPQDDQKVYFVRDNGAGFDMAYVEKLFGAFQRLHGPKEFEGSGIGLATVQRIIHRHGGIVWAEGKVGDGATFYFKLPA